MRQFWLLLFLHLLPIQCKPEPQSLLPKTPPCTLNNIALIGGDLPESDGGGGIRTSDAEECRYECNRRAQCRFWSYVAEWQVGCYLKSVAGEERSMEGAVTGWKGDGCAPVTQRQEPSRLIQKVRNRQHQTQQRRKQGLLDNTGCKYENIALLGADLPPDLDGDGITVRSFVECRAACREQSRCQAFTFVKEWDLNCFLKERKGEESEFEGALSGTLAACSAALATGGQRRRPRPSPPPSPSRPRPSSPVSAKDSSFFQPARPSLPTQPVIVTPQADDKACLFPKTNFLGGGLSAEEGGQGIETKDHDDCSSECQKRPLCHYWTFVGKWKVNCYLKSRLGEKSEFEDGISGTYGTNCAALEQPSSSSGGSVLAPTKSGECVFDNTNFLGGGLTAAEGGQGIETKNYQDCSLECQKRPLCNFWTFVGKWKVNCYLKSRLGEKSEFEGGISGTYDHFCDPLQPVQPRPKPPTSGASLSSVPVDKNEACEFSNTNFMGGGLPESEGGQGIRTTDELGCNEECKRRPKCNFWTFVKDWQINCYLKATLGQRTEFHGAVSGTYGIHCGNDGRKPASPSGSLHSSSGPEQGLVPDGGGCRYPKVNLQGGDLPPDARGHGIVTPDADHCRNECGEQIECQFWTFVKEWKVNCYLKDKKGPSREMEGAVSGALLIPCDQESKDNLGETGDPRTNDHECAYEGITFMGADLPEKHGGLGIPTKTAEACRLKCLGTPYCKHWVHIKGWRVNCYLKADRVTPQEKEEAISGSIGVRCMSGATSLPSDGGKTGGNSELGLEGAAFKPAIISRPTNNQKNHCTYPGVNYRGGDLPHNLGGHGLETSSPKACAAECETRSSCQFWTHVKEWKVNCYLKTTFDFKEDNGSATSGSIGITCDDDQSDLSEVPRSSSSLSNKVPKNPSSQPENVCFYPKISLSGGDLIPDGLQVSDVNNCALACYERDECLYFQFVSKWKKNCFLKTHFFKEETFPEAIAGSIGLSCT